MAMWIAKSGQREVLVLAVFRWWPSVSRGSGVMAAGGLWVPELQVQILDRIRLDDDDIAVSSPSLRSRHGAPVLVSPRWDRWTCSDHISMLFSILCGLLSFTCDLVVSSSGSWCLLAGLILHGLEREPREGTHSCDTMFGGSRVTMSGGFARKCEVSSSRLS